LTIIIVPEELIPNIDEHANLKNKENYDVWSRVVSVGVFKMDLCSDSNSFGRNILDYL
jgi:hypothetical protein